MHHVMLDIETLGKGGHALILSVGACYFDPATGEIGNTFHQHVDIEDACRNGLTSDPSTILWWFEQSENARKAIVDGQKDSLSLCGVMTALNAFIRHGCQVWGNGISFDNVIIKNAMETVMVPIPWKFRNERDVRTIVDLGRAIGTDPKNEMPFTGTKHDALADAIHQAKYVSAIWQALTTTKPEIGK